ncbi:MAG: Crp/Fnr family transcriptional regulator [Peptococcaceae bacterium]|nr:Crp/Fnr family transcriptional regulator [Peptococcaceae bacterium]
MKNLLEMPGVHFRKIKKGTVFIKQGEPVEYLYYLTSGYFYRIMTTAKGDEVIYSVKSASDDLASCLVGVFCIFGNHSSCTHIGRTSSTDFVAMTDCEGYMVPKETFYDYVQSDPVLLMHLLDTILDEYTLLLCNYQSHQEHSVANRLCQLLLEYSLPNQDNSCRLVGVKNVELAGFLGVHKVTVARIIKALKEMGTLERREDGLYIIDVPQLEAYAKGERLEYH